MKKRTVLIVEDNPHINDTLKEYLENKDFEVVSATNSSEANNYLQKQDFDIALLDLLLSDKKGFEILSTARKEKNLPVIAISEINIQSDFILVDEKDLLAEIEYLLQLNAKESLNKEII